MSTVEITGTGEHLAVSKIICIGRNYADHAKEMNAVLPEVPVFFLKPTTALLGDGGSILIPSISKVVHHEVEMTVLLGKGGKNVPREKALQHVAGFGIGLDMTLRDVQSEAKKNGLPWTLAKGFDTSAPVSSFVPSGAVKNPNDLGVLLNVNGVTRQQSRTRHLIFPIETLISYLSQFMTLEKGDIIFTGTPEGVAQVHPGDTLEAKLSETNGKVLTSLRVHVQ